ncbi:MAG: ABC transporter permease subunit [Deltaproteobacteria bacterium]|jgi:phosphate transport system permease protein|nr:ABC transporter permease subunit [Deltaproteobacteria bacterium]
MFACNGNVETFVLFRLSDKSEKWIEWILLIATCISAVAIIAILSLLVAFCLPLFTLGRIRGVLSSQWQPSGGYFGILPMCAGSLALSLLALSIAFPAAMGICTLLHVLARGVFNRFLLATVRFMTGIPTVVYGFVSVFLLVPPMREWLGAGTGFSLLTAAFTLSLLILPTIVLVLHARLEQIDPILRLASEALGLTPIQQMRHVLFPVASRGMVVAAVLGMGRAIGDTLISLMVAGNAPQFPVSLYHSIRTLTAHVALVVATDSRSMAYQSVFAAGLGLFLVTGLITLFIRKSGKAGREVRREKGF